MDTASQRRRVVSSFCRLSPVSGFDNVEITLDAKCCEKATWHNNNQDDGGCQRLRRNYDSLQVSIRSPSSIHVTSNTCAGTLTPNILTPLTAEIALNYYRRVASSSSQAKVATTCCSSCKRQGMEIIMLLPALCTRMPWIFDWDLLRRMSNAIKGTSLLKQRWNLASIPYHRALHHRLRVSTALHKTSRTSFSA